MAEYAGLTEITLGEAARVEEILERLIQRPRTDYLPTTHRTEHHIELDSHPKEV